MNILSTSVGISTITPDTNAILDIVSTSKGVLIPRMTTTQKIAIVSPVTGLEVYDTTLNSPSWFNGTSWAAISTASGWGITGNTGTVSPTNFFGTTDTQPITIKADNFFAGVIPCWDNSSLIIGFRSGSPSINTGFSNTTFGNLAMSSAGSGGYNTSVGYYANSSNSSGENNVAIGGGALNGNTTGSDNTVVGTQTLSGNGVFNNNTVMGAYSAGSLIGQFNTILGGRTVTTALSGSYNTVIGAQVVLSSGTNNNIILADGQGNRRINITAVGNVGIGTIAPTVALDVAGNVRVRTFPNSATTATKVSPVGLDDTGNLVRGYFASGVIDMGDVGGSLTAGSGSAMFNATFSKTGTNSSLNVFFTSPNANTNYMVFGELSGNSNATTFYTSNKTTTGFQITFQEFNNVVQTCKYEFMVFNR